ncbi:hypothetical protein BROUX41_000198 [Berkeleyomyces rouxiae]|uniref:uncharacterized protein n=1 Tax=Berkeleyomyces rouxiae TaxID=2035830 RepID=UPI003B7CCEA3
MRCSSLAFLVLIQLHRSSATPIYARQIESDPVATQDASPTPTTAESTSPSQTIAYISTSIVAKVPSCAKTCYLNAIASKFDFKSTCGLTPSLQCLCSLTSSNGMSLDETAVSCIDSDCSDGEVSDDEKAKAHAICDISTSTTSLPDLQASTALSKTSVSEPTSTQTPSSRPSFISSSTTFSTSARLSATTVAQVSNTVLPVIETSSVSVPNSTYQGGRTDDSSNNTKSLAAGQAIGLGFGLAGAILIGLIAIIYGRKRRFQKFEALYLQDNSYRKSGAKTNNVIRSSMLEISAPMHNDLPMGSSSSTPSLAHFGDTEEGHAHELYMMENAPSKAFIAHVTPIGIATSTSGDEILVSSAKSSRLRQSMLSSGLNSFGRSSHHQRLPSEDFESTTTSPRHKTANNSPKLPFDRVLIPPSRIHERRKQKFVAELEGRPIKPASPSHKPLNPSHSSHISVSSRNTSKSPRMATSGRRDTTSRAHPTRESQPPQSVLQASPQGVPPTRGRRMTRRYETDRDSMMTEFEEDSFTSERERGLGRGRPRVITSTETFLSMDHSSQKLVPQPPVSRSLTSQNHDFPFAAGTPYSSGSEIPSSQALRFHSPIQAYNPGAKARHAPQKTFQPYSPIEDDEDDHHPQSLTSAVSPLHVQPPFRIITSSNEVNQVYNDTEFLFQEHLLQNNEVGNRYLDESHVQQRDNELRSNLGYVEFPNTVPAPLRIPSLTQAQVVTFNRHHGR